MCPIPLEKDELIGQWVRIISCTDPTMENMVGIIIDETTHMFLIESQGKQRWIAKDIATFIFSSHDEEKPIHGKALRYRPEVRVKKTR